MTNMRIRLDDGSIVNVRLSNNTIENYASRYYLAQAMPPGPERDKEIETYKRRLKNALVEDSEALFDIVESANSPDKKLISMYRDISKRQL